jgi:hypothetical protein
MKFDIWESEYNLVLNRKSKPNEHKCFLAHFSTVDRKIFIEVKNVKRRGKYKARAVGINIVTFLWLRD